MESLERNMVQGAVQRSAQRRAILDLHRLPLSFVATEPVRSPLSLSFLTCQMGIWPPPPHICIRDHVCEIGEWRAVREVLDTVSHGTTKAECTQRSPGALHAHSRERGGGEGLSSAVAGWGGMLHHGGRLPRDGGRSPANRPHPPPVRV